MSNDTTPFNDENTKLLPDSPGIWFYHGTGMPNKVIRQEDGELYFLGGPKQDQLMLVSEFAKLKEADSILKALKFTKLSPVIDAENSLN